MYARCSSWVGCNLNEVVEVIDRRVGRHADTKEYRKNSVTGQHALELPDEDDFHHSNGSYPKDSAVPEDSDPTGNRTIRHSQARLLKRLTYR